jgi:hypothetical protein
VLVPASLVDEEEVRTAGGLGREREKDQQCVSSLQ